MSAWTAVSISPTQRQPPIFTKASYTIYTFPPMPVLTTVILSGTLHSRRQPIGNASLPHKKDLKHSVKWTSCTLLASMHRYCLALTWIQIWICLCAVVIVIGQWIRTNGCGMWIWAVALISERHGCWNYPLMICSASSVPYAERLTHKDGWKP